MQFVREMPSADSLFSGPGRDLRSGGDYDEYGRKVNAFGVLPNGVDVYSPDQLAQARPSDLIQYTRRSKDSEEPWVAPAWLAKLGGGFVEQSAGFPGTLGYQVYDPKTLAPSPYIYASRPLRAPAGFANTNPEDVYATPWNVTIPDPDQFTRLKDTPEVRAAFNSNRMSLLNGQTYDILDKNGNVSGTGVLQGLRDGDNLDQFAALAAATIATFGAASAAAAGAAAAEGAGTAAAAEGAGAAGAVEGATFTAANTAPYFEVTHALGDVVTLTGSDLMLAGTIDSLALATPLSNAELPYFETTHAMGDVINLGGNELFQAGSLAAGTLVPAQATGSAAQSLGTPKPSITPSQILDTTKAVLGTAAAAQSVLGSDSGRPVGGAGVGTVSVPRVSGNPAQGDSQTSSGTAATSGGVSGASSGGFAQTMNEYAPLFLALGVVGIAALVGSR